MKIRSRDKQDEVLAHECDLFYCPSFLSKTSRPRDRVVKLGFNKSF